MKTKKEKIIEKAKELILRTFNVGVQYLFRSERFILKLMWMIFFILASVGTIFAILKLISNYLAYELIPNIYVYNIDINNLLF